MIYREHNRENDLTVNITKATLTATFVQPHQNQVIKTPNVSLN